MDGIFSKPPEQDGAELIPLIRVDPAAGTWLAEGCSNISMDVASDDVTGALCVSSHFIIKIK